MKYKKGANKKASRIFTLFNLVIKVKEGQIYDIVWDNSCYDCIDNCEKNIKSYDETKSKTMTYQNCYEPNIGECTDNQCDPKFYITWFGTDKNGAQLKSSNLAMSKFKQYSISSLYSSVKDIFKE